MAVESLIQQFGLTKKQTELFLAVITHGPKPASFLARVCKAERTNTYKTAMSLVEKGVFRQSNQNGTTIFFVPDKEVFRKHVLFEKKRLEEQEKLLPELEQELLHLEQTQQSPLPKMRFYQGVAGIENLFHHMTDHILSLGLLQIKCFATNTISSFGMGSCAHVQEAFEKTLYTHHIGIEITLASGIQLLENIVKSTNIDTLATLPTGNNTVHIYIVKHIIYIAIYKSIPVGLYIESDELAEVLFFMLKHLKP